MTDAVTPERVREWRAMAEAATPGEWFLPFEDGAIASTSDPGVSLLGLDLDGMAVFPSRGDAVFVAAAREAIPAPCDAPEEAWRERDEAQSVARHRGVILAEEPASEEEYEAALSTHGASMGLDVGLDVDLIAWLAERLGDRGSLIAQVKALTAALRRYGRHTGGCGLDLPGHTCACDWDATRRDLLGDGR